MTQAQKNLLFRVTFWGAGGLYIWALIVFWMAPEWELSGWTYYFLGVLPALAGVGSMTTALGLYVDLQKEE
jgi:hypothetical protein